MTDRELIELLRHQTPDELSAEEIALLRARIVDSPAVRDALLDQLRIDHYLHDSIGGVQVSVDKIIAASAAAGGMAAKPFSRWLAWGFGAVVAIVGTTLLLGPRIGLFGRVARPVVARHPADDSSILPGSLEEGPSGENAPPVDSATASGEGEPTVPGSASDPNADWAVDDESSPSDSAFGDGEGGVEGAGPADPPLPNHHTDAAGTAPAVPTQLNNEIDAPNAFHEPDPSPEAAAVLSAFHAALADGSYVDACRALSGVNASQAANGLVRDSRDPQLFVSLRAAVQRAFDEHPLLAPTMREWFSEQGQSLVRQAINAADSDALQAATIQFFGTPAAADAHAWLGDRALAGGDFTLAAVEFRKALESSADTDTSRLNARLRLANALLGRDEGVPVQMSIELGDRRLAAGEFEALVNDLRKQPAASSGMVPTFTSAPQATAPPPAQYDLRSWTSPAFVAGDGESAPAADSSGPSWRRPTAAITGGLMLAMDGTGVEAIDLTNGVRRWTAHLSAPAVADAGATGGPATMVIADNHVFLRLWSDPGGELACLRLDDGAVVWRSRPDPAVVGGPLFMDGRFIALVAVAENSATTELRLAGFDPQTGAVLFQRTLIRLRTQPDRPLECGSIAVGDRLVAELPLGLLCCDSCGELQWLRHQPGQNGGLDSAGLHPDAFPTLVKDDAVYCLNPSGNAVDCLDLADGLVRWHRDLPGAIELAGINGSRLFVRAESSVLAIETTDGAIAWSHASANPRGAWIDEAGGRVLVQSASGDDATSPTRLTWLDLATGTVVNEATVTNWPTNGTLVGDSDRAWIIAAGGAATSPCQILELVRSGDSP